MSRRERPVVEHRGVVLRAWPGVTDNELEAIRDGIDAHLDEGTRVWSISYRRDDHTGGGCCVHLPASWGELAALQYAIRRYGHRGGRVKCREVERDGAPECFRFPGYAGSLDVVELPNGGRE